ncbi:MAG: SurA N-terminal domain-containing protein [Betaproteobacteria bacterium]|jgi:peptidyl-prolyl cis-trans isomerase D|nr:SurA N-terminal domain-containing protein [Betaproteobacteria bacterium]
MYDFVHKQKRIAQIILALLILPFAFFGMESYFQGGGREPHVAEVGGEKIYEREFDRRLREQQDRMREALGAQARPEMFEGAEFRTAVIEGMIQERLLQAAANASGLRVSDAQLQAVIAGQPEFQENGAFSLARYQSLLRTAGMTEVMYQERVRTELALSQVQAAFTAGTIVPASVVDRVVRALDQQREASQLAIAPESFLAEVKLEADAVQKFYEANRRQFEIPEQVRVEYVVLSQAALAAQLTVAPQEAREFYEQNASQFRGAVERQASHILIRVAPGADEKTKAAAREQAAAIAEQVKKAPQTFADVARKRSEDPGSAAQGGDLGFFASGTMVKAFDQAVFAMKPGEIVGPVESEAGFHVIRLTAVRGEAGPGFEQVRAKVEEELRRTRASRRFAELADSFTNTVFEQSETLKPAADLLGQPLQTSGWFGRQGGDAPKGSNERLLAAVFAEDVLRDKRNTAAIEVAPGVLMAARVVENKPARLRPLAEVSAALEKRLRFERASEMAIDAGRKRLAELRAGKDAGTGWSPPQMVNRQQPGALPEAAVRQLFRADVSKLPAFVGVEQPGGGYLLLRVSRVVESRGIDPNARAGFARQAYQLAAQEQVSAYIASLRSAAKVKLSSAATERPQ